MGKVWEYIHGKRDQNQSDTATLTVALETNIIINDNFRCVVMIKVAMHQKKIPILNL